MLEAGRSYRFRLRPANIEGLEGPASESVVSLNSLFLVPGLLFFCGGSILQSFVDVRKRCPFRDG